MFNLVSQIKAEKDHLSKKTKQVAFLIFLIHLKNRNAAVRLNP